MLKFDPMCGMGFFNSWLEGTSFSSPANGTHVASLFRVIYDGDPGVFTVSLGAGPYVQGAKNNLRWEQTTAGFGSTYRMIEARIADATMFHNGLATVSFYGTSSVDGIPVQVEIVQNFGTGGNPNSPTGQASDEVVVFSDWAALTQGTKKVQFSFSVPSCGAKYFGNNWDDHVKVRIKVPATSVFDVTLGELFFQEGGASAAIDLPRTATASQAQHLDQHLQILKVSLQGEAVVAGRYFHATIPFRTLMRQTPVATCSGPANLRTNLHTDTPVPLTTYMSPAGGCMFIRAANVGAFFAIDHFLKLDARL